jgi:hypothetical protein
VVRKNRFMPFTPEEKLAKEKELQTIQERIASVAKLASECLDDPKFKKYREEFEKMKLDVFEQMAQPLDCDPVKDGHYLRACVNTLLILEKILIKPQKDAKRGQT